MGKKMNNSKITKKLALLITAKTGNDDKVEVVAQKVLTDYFAAKKIVAEYKQVSSPKKCRNKKRQATVGKWDAEDELQNIM
ncbi:MAG: hypothetical protein P4N59_23285 [Negativicutes bacterium]|nr:hypothetical protein [Negativicutes bacterium]